MSARLFDRSPSRRLRTSRFGYAVAVVAALAWLPGGRLAAQQPRYAPLVLQVPAGTRATGIGGAAVAVRDIEAIFWNPAMVGMSVGTAVAFGRFNHGAGLGSIAASGTAGPMGVGIGAQFLSFDVLTSRVPQPSAVLTLDGGIAAASSVTGSVAVATVFKGYRVGAALKYVREQAAIAQDGSAAFDLGVTKDFGRVTWGAAVQNIGSDLKLGISSAQLPLRSSIGASIGGITVGAFDLNAAGSVSVLRNGYVAPAGGLEFGYAPLEGYNVVARLGVRRPELSELRPLTGGATISFDRISLDYAFEDLLHGVSHRLAFRLR